jgi:hypothetical protein
MFRELCVSTHVPINWPHCVDPLAILRAFDIRWPIYHRFVPKAPRPTSDADRAPSLAEPKGLTIFDAGKKLGLKLMLAMGTSEVLMIGRVERLPCAIGLPACEWAVGPRSPMKNSPCAQHRTASVSESDFTFGP